MTRYITQLVATNVYDEFSYTINFDSGINVIYGTNGIGKTTILHIIANAIQEDWLRFATIEFNVIRVFFSDETEITISQSNRKSRLTHHHSDITVRLNGKEIFKQENICEWHLTSSRKSSDVVPTEDALAMSVAYFPAFRLFIDALSDASQRLISEQNNINFDYLRDLHYGDNQDPHDQSKTSNTIIQARNIFGQFVPYFDFPSATAIENALNDLLNQAIAQVNAVDRDQFIAILSHLLDDTELTENQPSTFSSTAKMVEEIKKLLIEYRKYPIHVKTDLWQKLEKQLLQSPSTSDTNKLILMAFYNALQRIVQRQQQSLGGFEILIESINQFLIRKKVIFIATTDESPLVQLQIGNDKTPISDFYRILSSGERHILALIYSASQASISDIILVDEPEISLHINWQRKLLSELQKHMGDKQIIVCTHSPEIGEYHLDRITNLTSDIEA